MAKISLTKQLVVDLAERSYPIYIGENLLLSQALLQKHIQATQILLVSNETVAPLYLQTVLNALDDFQCSTLILKDGEEYKDVNSFSLIIDALVAGKHHRDTTLVALGGGVIGDMTGFAAACYQRGVNFIQLPTTLLAQVDASVGGKTGINHHQGKNLIGAFYQPRAVIIDISSLTTLPAREFKAGLAEVIKCGLLKDGKFFAWLEDNVDALLAYSATHLSYAIARCCEIKAEIVASDERESGQRALLNLGHTFAHAIEAATGYKKWLHGEAVAMGLYCAALLSGHIGTLDEESIARIVRLLSSMGLPYLLGDSLDEQQLLDLIKHDKKIKNNKLHLILLSHIGRAHIDDTVDEKMLLWTLKKAQ